MITIGRWMMPAVALLLGAALAGCASAPPTAASGDLEQRIATASTRADHEALALNYDKLAADARTSVAMHRNMAKAYAGPRSLPSMEGHCDTIVANYESIAKANEALAADHRRMAAQAKP